MGTFSNIRFKAKTAARFQRYSRSIARTHTEALEAMLDFFEDNGVSPKESLGPKIVTLENLIKKRVNGLVAIIKSIEKTQTQPMLAMLQLLFEETLSPKKELLLERQATIKTEASNVDPKLQVLALQKENLELKRKLQVSNANLEVLLKNVTVIRNSFGRSHYRLNLSEEALEKIKNHSTPN
ncbi:BfmA/BtgA family mobilization protein [Sediminicola arcticus]|uniref:BfmA/BtgA family mobilization protein n=1 Tax=Sediminicola arcticus TaxID=1574308 RepID=A0ABV2SPT5_9FLAO